MVLRQEQRTHQNVIKDIVNTRTNILKYQAQLIENWKPRSDVWPLLYGRAFLTAAAAFTGAYINHRFRRKMKLRNYGFFPSTLGLVTAPAAMTSVFYSELILHKLMLFEISCPLCLESRAALLQNCTGLLLPLVLAPLGNFSIAAGSGMYNVPHMFDVKGLFRVISSIYKPMIPQIATFFTFHALLASYVTYSQVKSFLYIQDVKYLIEREKEEQMHTS